MNKNTISKIMICLLVTILFFIILLSEDVVESVSFSISIWKDNLFPTLFPFFIISNLLINYGFVYYIGLLLNNIMQKYFKLPGCCGFVLAASLFTGFPSGAKYTKDLVEKKLITIKEAESLLTFTHYSNPLFILGMIGTTLLNNKILGLIILISHITSGLIVGIILNKNNKIAVNNTKNDFKYSNKTFGELLTDSIFDSLNTMFLLLGIVTIFLIITTIINKLIPLSPILRVILSGILEMTQGVKLASTLLIPDILKIMLMTGFISFGGLSVHMQVLGLISTQKIKYKPFLLSRILHSIIAMLFAFILYNLNMIIK